MIYCCLSESARENYAILEEYLRSKNVPVSFHDFFGGRAGRVYRADPSFNLALSSIPGVYPDRDVSFSGMSDFNLMMHDGKPLNEWTWTNV